MFNTLYSRLALLLLALFCLVGVMFFVAVRFSLQMYQQEVVQTLNRRLAVDIIAEDPRLSGGQADGQVLKDIFKQLMVINPSIELYLLDPRGTIQAFSAEKDRVERRRVSLEPVSRFLREDAALPILGEDPRDRHGKKIFSAAPIGPRADPVGYLYIILGGEAYDNMARLLEGGYIHRLAAWGVGAGLLFTLAAGLAFVSLLTARLRHLAAAMEAFEQADFAAPVELPRDLTDRSRDEIGRLGRSFDEMAKRIAQQLQALKRTDAQRRELLANVSHDLRTPLASMQGYLETLLLKDASLGPEERHAYLEIALRHAERLGKLVAELFELGKLVCQEAPPRHEAFPIGELVQDVVQKFQLSARKRSISLESELGQALPFVHADIALIERALENLMENALRYTPDGGTIRVAAFAAGHGVAVQVADSGPGIAPEELRSIFDRFYRVERGSEPGPGPAGLGLAITKRIIELHGGSITATSTVGGGSTFTIELPVGPGGV